MGKIERYKPKQMKVDKKYLNCGEEEKEIVNDKPEIKLTRKQKIFADKYLETHNGTRSALEAYDTTDERTAQAIGSENLSKPMIKAYLADKGDKAGSYIEKVLEDDNLDPRLRFDSAKFIYEQVYGKATQKVITKEDDDQFNKRLDFSKIKSMSELEELRKSFLK